MIVWPFESHRLDYWRSRVRETEDILESKREDGEKSYHTTWENNLRNHGLKLSLAMGEIALDNPWAFTYYTRTCAKGLASNAREIYMCNRVNRGADSHDE